MSIRIFFVIDTAVGLSLGEAVFARTTTVTGLGIARAYARLEGRPIEVIEADEACARRIDRAVALEREKDETLRTGLHRRARGVR